MNRYHDGIYPDPQQPQQPRQQADSSSGLKARVRELTDLQEAARSGSTQAKIRLSAARKAAARQENVAEGRPALAPRPKKRS